MAAVLVCAFALGAPAVGPAGARVAGGATPLVNKAPKVTTSPSSATVGEGQSASFEAAASGSPAPTVQWQISTDEGAVWGNVAGATTDKLTIADAKVSESGDEYRAVFKNASGQATTKVAILTVQQKAPAVVRQPSGVTVEEGHNASFEATASGFPAPTVQWEVSTDAGASWSAVAGATSDQLTLAGAKTSEDGEEYRAVFESVAGKATSEAAKLTVHNPPKLTEQPRGSTVQAGQSATFEALASGYPTPTVQWESSTNAGSSWSTVAGATSDQLTVSDVTSSQSGTEYRAVFASVAGSAYSEAATLTVAVHQYTAVAWGQNTYGQLGNVGTEPSYVPEPVDGLAYVTGVAGGTRHSLALLSSGTVMAWGADEWGQLGGGGETLSMSDVPLQVPGLTSVTALAAGADFSLALRANGTVMAWGGNQAGQLGDGTTEESEAPVAVKGLTGVTAIAASGEHALALLSSGKVMAWGAGERGQLGNGNANDSAVPVNVQGITAATAIAAGGQHSLAVLSSGKAMAWGADEYGQLGNSSVPEDDEGERISEVPVFVEGVSGASAVAAGARHSLALLGNGTVIAWGEDKAGELGTGSIARSDEVPAAVSGLAGASAISAGGEHSMALLGNGTVMTWGEDRFGELGTGTAGEASDVPVAVSALGEVTGISAGGSHDLAYGETIPTVTGLSPDAGAATGGTQVTITGTDFSEASAVRFGSASANAFKVESSTKIVAQAPAGAVGTVDVTVTTAAGTSAKSSADRFSYLAAPTIKKIAPKTGPAAGGTVVTITGTGLAEASAVSFGAGAGKVLSLRSSTSITVESPAGTGTVAVTVTTPGGTSAPAGKASFKYKTPKTKK